MFNNEYAAKIYDIQHSQNKIFPKIQQFMEKLAEQYGINGILDVGCGTGNLAIYLVKLGYQVTGIDFSHEMLNIANQKKNELTDEIRKRLKFIHGNMTDFSLNRKFSMAMIPGGVFCHLTEEEDQIMALKNVAHHLYEGGILCMDTIWPSLEIIYNNQNSEHPKRSLSMQFENKDGNQVEVFDEIFIDYPNQKLYGKVIYVETIKTTGEKTEISLPMNLRLTYPSEMRLLFKICGFEVLHEHSFYEEKPISYPNRITWLLKKTQ